MIKREQSLSLPLSSVVDNVVVSFFDDKHFFDKNYKWTIRVLINNYQHLFDFIIEKISKRENLSDYLTLVYKLIILELC